MTIPSGWVHAFKRLAIVGASIIVALTLCEAAVRVFTETSAPLTRNHPVLGKTYVPNYSGTRFVPESGRTIEFRFNRDGLRDLDRPYERPAGTRRIAVIGDSMIAAVAVDEESTAVRVLERLLRESQTDIRWEVINAGISGSGPGQELVLYHEVVRKYHPDVVVFAFFVGNDLVDSSRELTGSSHRIYFRVDEGGELVRLPHSTARRSLSIWLDTHSRLYPWWKDRSGHLRNWLVRSSGSIAKGQLIHHSEPVGQLERAWQIVEKLIAAMKCEVEADGAGFAVALLPTADQVLDEPWTDTVARAGDLRDKLDRDYPQKRFREIGARLDIPVILMADAFREAAPHRSMAFEDEWLHFSGKYHFNVAGNRLAAEIIHRFFTESDAGRALFETATRRPSIVERPSEFRCF